MTVPFIIHGTMAKYQLTIHVFFVGIFTLTWVGPISSPYSLLTHMDEITYISEKTKETSNKIKKRKRKN